MGNRRPGGTQSGSRGNGKGLERKGKKTYLSSDKDAEGGVGFRGGEGEGELGASGGEGWGTS